MYLIDSHAHITCDRLYEDRKEILARAKQHGVKRMMVVCTNFEEYERAVHLQCDGIIFDVALGFHPSDLLSFKEEDFIHLEEVLATKQLAALGEIGLDYHWDEVDKETQKKGFIRQIHLANRYQLPMIIHMREATQDTLTILKEYAQTKFVMHCFSGSKETAEEVIRMGGYISFAGPLTFKNAKGLTEVPQIGNLHHVLVETDCPYLTPHPHRGKTNEPMYVGYTFDKLCALLNKGKEEMSLILERNYKSFINRSENHRTK